MFDDSLRGMLVFQDTSSKPRPYSIIPCLLCGKPFLIGLYSGNLDQVCPECYKTYQDCATLSCVKCRVVLAKVKPGVMDCGFVIKPKADLHSDCCNVCKPGLDRSTVVEVDLWMKTQRRPKIIMTGKRS